MKKVLKISIAILIIGGLLLWLINYFTIEKVDISSNNANAQITLTKVGDTSFSKSGVGSMSLKLRTGKYIAVVEANSQGISNIVNIKARQTSRYILNPPPTIGVEPVWDGGGSYVAASGSHLFYIDNASQSIYGINNQNNISEIDSTPRFTSAQWASATMGVAEDTNGQLYIINNGSVSLLKIPTPLANYYAIAANGDIYFSHNNDIYRENKPGNFTKIYTAQNTFTSLVASINGVTIISSPTADSPKTRQTFATNINKSGKIVSRHITIYSSSNWSPDGLYLASAGNADYKIYDASLREIADMPNVAISNPIWIDDTNLIYSVKDQLWKYSVPSGRSVLVANMPLGAAISQISLSDDKAYAYVSLAGLNGGSGSIKRINLKAHTVPRIVYQLQDVLPINEEGCSFMLVNFTAPVVMVVPASAAQSQICLQNTGLQLSQDGLDLTLFQIKLGI